MTEQREGDRVYYLVSASSYVLLFCAGYILGVLIG